MLAQSTLNKDLRFHSKSAFVISSSAWFLMILRGCWRKRLVDRVGGMILSCV
jgi:hypothetical protein